MTGQPPSWATTEMLGVLEAAPDAMLVVDGTGAIAYANSRAEQLFGYNPAELIGKPVVSLVPNSILEEELPHPAGSFTGPPIRPTGSGTELFGVRKDGSTFPAEISVSPFQRSGMRFVISAIRDIRQRRRAEEQIASERTKQEDEERYRKLVEISPDAILVQQNGRIVFVNPACTKLLGAATPGKLIGRSVFDIVAAEYQPLVRACMERGQQGKVVPPASISWVRLDGPAIDVEVLASPFTWQGEAAVQVVARDIGERKRAEAVLREGEERFRTLLDSTAEAIYGLTLDGTCTFVNAACLHMLGYGKAEELLGKNMHQAIHHSRPDGSPYPADECPMFKPLRAGDRNHVENELFWRADGSSFPVELWSHPVYKDGTLTGAVVACLDITERKRSEAALRHSEERYRLLFEMNPQPMWVYDLGTLRFLAVNQAAVEHYGYSRQEFLAMSLRDIRPPEDVAAMEESVHSATDPIDRAGVWRHVTKHGRLIHVEISEGNIEFEGRAARLVLAYDVTERVQGEETLRLQAAALESAANAILITDAGGNIQWVNPAFERLTRYSLGEIMGQTPRVLQSGRHDPEFYREMWHAILAGCVWQGELINRRKDGSLYTEHQTITPVRDANGTITNFVGIKVDVTDQKRAEEALKRSESEFRSIVEHAPYGIYRVSLEGEILMANPALARMLGYGSPEELIGRETATHFYLSSEARKDSAARWLGKEVVSPYEVSWKRKDGTPIQVRLAGRTVPGEAGAAPVYEVFVADITEQHLLEQQFRQAQKMEAVGRLAGGVAHDFNNLLMVINSYAELLLQSGTADPTARRYTEQIRDAGMRAASVTQQLLAFSRKQVLSPSILDLNEVVTNLGKLLARLLGEDVQIENALAKDLAKVRVDRTQMEQILMNLAVNARDAMPKGGRLVIETANVHVDETHARQHPTMKPGDYVVIAVSDSGMGMEKSVVEHIFEPFFTTKGAGKGTGLGLAMVYGVVKQSGGFIWVYSEPGIGTTMKVYFPQAKAEPKRSKAENVPGPAPGGSETVLIVEDEAALRAAASEFLAAKGYTVIGAANGAEALQCCSDLKTHIDIMLTDVVMPGMGGIELAKSVLALRPKLKVIYMSGYSDRAIDVAQLRSGGVLLQKPFGLDALAGKVRSVLDQENAKGQGSNGND